MPIPILPLAMSVAEIIPSIAGLFKGKNAESQAQKVISIARQITGIEDPEQAISKIKLDSKLSFELESKIIDAKLRGDLAEYEDEADRRKDIRESGWLSSHVRPVIALTFHFFIWGVVILCSPETVKAKLNIVLFSWKHVNVTIGLGYLIIVCFYFMTKGMKDYFIGKNPLSGR